MYAIKIINGIHNLKLKGETQLESYVNNLALDIAGAHKLEIHVTNHILSKEGKFHNLPFRDCYYEIYLDGNPENANPVCVLLNQVEHVILMDIFSTDNNRIGFSQNLVMIEDESANNENYSVRVFDVSQPLNPITGTPPAVDINDKYLEVLANIADIVFHINRVLDTTEVMVQHMTPSARFMKDTNLLSTQLEYDHIELEL